VKLTLTDPEPSPAQQALRTSAATPARTASRLLWNLGQCVAVAALAMACYFVISRFVLQSVQVVGKSMVPTLYDSQHYLLNRWIYHVRAPQRSDIVVVRDPSDGGFSVKRIIAIAGDSVYLKEGSVYLNGEKLNEPYLRPGTWTLTDSKFREQLILCGHDQYFLLGDNRRFSVDSRNYGPIARRDILGLIVR
jgi:signal peptidase I